MSNINVNNSNKIKTKISKSEYWDLKLIKGDDSFSVLDGSNFYDSNLISCIDINNNTCIGNSGETLYSIDNYKWDEAVNDGLLLNNIGFVGIDNGVVVFDKETILPNEFGSLLSGSSFSIQSGDTRLVLKAISGNTGEFKYDTSIVNEIDNNHILLNGGFYQGFFKSGDYCVLPTNIENEICFDFVLRPDFVTVPSPNTLNYKYPNNKGLFFYIGARSENKFWYDYYNTDSSLFEISKTGQTTPSGFNESLSTNDGFDVYSQNVYDISTDNKYLLVNRSINGKNASSFDENVDYHITGVSNENVNLYLYVDRTSTGYTAVNTNTIPGTIKPYSVVNDLTRNAIGFLLKDDGSIGYRMINDDCDSELGYKIEEEYSNTGIVIDNELTFVSIRMILNGNQTCTSSRTFKLLFYVNGKLVFSSKQLPELLLRELSDRSEKQEGVPFCISLGGGSQGLCDMIGFNSGFTTQYLLPIEENFSGTMLGSIFKFRIFYGKTDFSKIKNNYNYEFYKIFNSEYIRPTIKFWITAVNISGPETIYKRETGNIASKFNATIKVNSFYYTLTGYKFFYYSDFGQRTQIGGTFNVPQYGGTIPEYVFDDSELAKSGVTELKYMIDVFDTYSNVSGTEKLQTITFDNMIFYGPTATTPIETDDIRSLPDRVFNKNTDNITLNTGARNRIFVVAVPSNRELVNVVDQSASYVDITNRFIFSQIEVEDAGKKKSLYNIYTMTNAIPYNRNHILQITLS